MSFNPLYFEKSSCLHIRTQATLITVDEDDILLRKLYDIFTITLLK